MLNVSSSECKLNRHKVFGSPMGQIRLKMLRSLSVPCDAHRAEIT
jgi:hypothetical protein